MPRLNREKIRRTWPVKFRDAGRGLLIGIAGQRSVWVQLTAGGGVFLAAWGLRCTLIEWAVLLICVFVVIAVELLNTAIEAISRAVTSRTDPHVRDALDIAAGAVLLVAIGSAVVGALVLGFRLGERIGWW